MQRSALAALAAIALGSLAGCSSDPKPEARTAETAPSASSTASPAASSAPAAKPDVATPTSGSVRIDDAILKACGDLPNARFAFDSAAVAPDADRGFALLAKCFVSGPLAGRTMHLTGHADPRGEAEYNFALGQKRAGSVASLLAGKGVVRAHLETDSRGALEATGTDEEGWANDRRVDISLKP